MEGFIQFIYCALISPFTYIGIFTGLIAADTVGRVKGVPARRRREAMQSVNLGEGVSIKGKHGCEIIGNTISGDNHGGHGIVMAEFEELDILNAAKEV